MFGKMRKNQYFCTHNIKIRKIWTNTIIAYLMTPQW